MAKSRKTFDVAELVKTVNRKNSLSTCDPKLREGWNALLVDILHETNNYMGYTHLTRSEVPYGQLAGIIRGDSIETNTFPDETRRKYYCRKV